MVLETAKSEVEFALEKTDLSIVYNVVTIPSDIDTDWGTADSLRYLSSYIIVRTTAFDTNHNVFGVNSVFLSFFSQTLL